MTTFKPKAPTTKGRPASQGALILQLISSRNKAVARIQGKLMMSVGEAAAKRGITADHLYKLIKADRVEGAYKSGNIWFLPTEWTYKKLKRGWKKGNKRHKSLVKRSDLI